MRGPRTAPALLALLLALAVVATACGGGARSPFRAFDEEEVGPPSAIDLPAPPGLTTAQRAQFDRGKAVVAQSGCLACHALGRNGNSGPGPELTHVGARLPAAVIRRTLVEPVAPMPSFAGLQDSDPRRFGDLVAMLSALR